MKMYEDDKKSKKWADLFAGPLAMHHDNFAIWNSKVTRWSSINYTGINPSAALKKN